VCIDQCGKEMCTGTGKAFYGHVVEVVVVPAKYPVVVYPAKPSMQGKAFVSEKWVHGSPVTMCCDEKPMKNISQSQTVVPVTVVPGAALIFP